MAAADDDQSGGTKRPPRGPTHGNPQADPVLVHRRYVEQRLWSGNTERDDDAGAEHADRGGSAERDDRAVDGDGGGESGLAAEEARSAQGEDGADDLGDLARERYVEAIDQWHRLPGSVSRPPTEVTERVDSLAGDPTDEDGRSAEGTDEASS